jgi:hypothetical protein
MSGNNRKGIVLRERDLILLREIAEMGVVDREQAKRVAGFGSTTRVNVRLLALTRNGFLRRFSVGTIAGGIKGLYALSHAGAKLVGVPYRGPRRASNRILVSDFWVNHQLHINEIYCIVKFLNQPNEHITIKRWISFSRPLESGSALIPDGYFEFSAAGKNHAAFLEVDLGHESHTVWKAKIEGYVRYAVSGHFAEEFHGQYFRVLVITNSDRRVQSLRAATAKITEKIFWFTTFEAIHRDGFWSAVWARPKGDERRSLG